MAWYWIAAASGMIVPFFIIGQSIRIAFQERGLLIALGLWLGSCVFTVPLMLALTGLGVWVIR